MNGAQWTRSGRDRENAILQGYLAQGYSYADAATWAANEATPADYDYYTGQALVWVFKAIIGFFLFLLLWGLGEHILFGAAHDRYEECFGTHTIEQIDAGVCGSDPLDY